MADLGNFVRTMTGTTTTAIRREDFADDESYVEARIQERLKQADPAYQAQRRQVMREEAERQEKEERRRQMDRYRQIREGVRLSQAQLEEITRQAQTRAAADVHAGRSHDLLGQVTKYEREMTDKAKDSAAAGIMFNETVRSCCRGE